MDLERAIKGGGVDLKRAFEKTWWGRDRILEAAARLPSEAWTREFDLSWRSLQGLVAHVVEVERGWTQGDIEGVPGGSLAEAERKHLYRDPGAARARSEAIRAETRRILEVYVPGRLAETRRAEDLNGKPADFTVEEILGHVFTHEIRHHGQIQAVFRLLGQAAPNLDWID
jgi:uncharacterized damage-inducible protein DinB